MSENKTYGFDETPRLKDVRRKEQLEKVLEFNSLFLEYLHKQKDYALDLRKIKEKENANR
jgi:hypothetical protein|tara:strand:- start:15842 stop:16021 length:180 start_codon:yes stop_codon:yes gene_type:complete